METYDLVSHGGSGQECYGDYNSTTQAGYGPVFENSCIHSGSTAHSGGNTVWYDYAAATAGTIIDENTTESNPAKNINTATESICPKGWSLPSKVQINENKDLTSFSPVLGGNYSNGALYDEAKRGSWWSSTAYIGSSRYGLYYSDSSLSTGGIGRRGGFYIRCVSEEKTVTDLTYMQDMTPTLADAEAFI